MNINTLNLFALISLIFQIANTFIKTNGVSWLGFFGFICYPIVILTLSQLYTNSTLTDRKKYIKTSIIYSIILLLSNFILLLLKNELSYTNLLENNLFLSFIIFIAIKKICLSLKSNRLSTKCNSFFFLLIITSLYLSVGNNMLFLCLFLVFDKSKNKLNRNILIVLLSIINPFLTGNLYSMGILLSIVFISENKTNTTKQTLNYKSYTKLLFASILISSIIKAIIQIGFMNI